MANRFNYYAASTGKIRICDMTDSHLQNAIRFIAEKAHTRKNDNINRYNHVYHGFKLPDEKMEDIRAVKDMFDFETDKEAAHMLLVKEQEKNFKVYVPDIYYDLCSESNYRGLYKKRRRN